MECNPHNASEISSIDDCCRHGVEPFGVSYVIPGDDSCVPCLVGKLTIFYKKSYVKFMQDYPLFHSVLIVTIARSCP